MSVLRTVLGLGMLFAGCEKEGPLQKANGAQEVVMPVLGYQKMVELTGEGGKMVQLGGSSNDSALMEAVNPTAVAVELNSGLHMALADKNALLSMNGNTVMPGLGDRKVLSMQLVGVLTDATPQGIGLLFDAWFNPMLQDSGVVTHIRLSTSGYAVPGGALSVARLRRLEVYGDGRDNGKTVVSLYRSYVSGRYWGKDCWQTPPAFYDALGRSICSGHSYIEDLFYYGGGLNAVYGYASC